MLGAYKKITALVVDLHRNVSGNFSRQPSFKSQLSTSSMQDHVYGNSSNTGLISDKHSEQSLFGAATGVTQSLYEKPKWDIEEESHFSQELAMKKFNIEDLTNENINKNEQGATFNGKDEIEVLKDGTTNTNSERILEDLSRKMLDANQRLVEYSIKNANLESKILYLEKVIKMFGENQRINKNGIHVWKIDNFENSFQYLKENETFSYSQPFYTSEFGYKFCLRINVLPTHDKFLSLYIHMMKGDHDDFLEWPFKGKICLEILDLGENTQKKKHFSDPFEICEELEAFKRPIKDRSVKCYGFKEFISYDQLLKAGSPGSSEGRLIKNDTIFIRASVRERVSN